MPLAYKIDGEECAYIVNFMDTNIFEGSICEKLIIPENTYIGSMDGTFDGALYLKEVYIYESDPGKFPPPSFSRIYAQNPAFKIHTPSMSGYKEHYNWTTLNDTYPGIIIEDL